jgi:hypothetical protein
LGANNKHKNNNKHNFKSDKKIDNSSDNCENMKNDDNNDDGNANVITPPSSATKTKCKYNQYKQQSSDSIDPIAKSETIQMVHTPDDKSMNVCSSSSPSPSSSSSLSLSPSSSSFTSPVSKMMNVDDVVDGSDDVHEMGVIKAIDIPSKQQPQLPQQQHQRSKQSQSNRLQHPKQKQLNHQQQPKQRQGDTPRPDSDKKKSQRRT